MASGFDIIRCELWRRYGIQDPVIRIITIWNPEMHNCYNLISKSIFYSFRALKHHHQKFICKNTGIIL